MAHVPPLCFALAVLILMAGCTQPGSDPRGNPAGEPTRHDLAVNSPVAVPAGEVFTQGFNAKGNIRVDYSFRSGDGDPVDAGFIRASDLAEYRQGSAVETWAYRQNTIDVQAGTTLPDGDFVFVIHCRNAFMDCDGVYGLWATY